MIGTIYGLKDPRTPWRIRYVGGTGDVMRRLNTHLLGWEQGHSHSIAMRDWFRALKKAGVQPEMEILDVVDIEQLPCQEREWIALLNSFFPLLNSSAMGRTHRKPIFLTEASDISVITETTA